MNMIVSIFNNSLHVKFKTPAPTKEQTELNNKLTKLVWDTATSLFGSPTVSDFGTYTAVRFWAGRGSKGSDVLCVATFQMNPSNEVYTGRIFDARYGSASDFQVMIDEFFDFSDSMLALGLGREVKAFEKLLKMDRKQLAKLFCEEESPHGYVGLFTWLKTATSRHICKKFIKLDKGSMKSVLKFLELPVLVVLNARRVGIVYSDQPVTQRYVKSAMKAIERTRAYLSG